MFEVPDRITSTSQLRVLAEDLNKVCGQLTANIPAYCRTIAVGVPQTLTANGVDCALAEVAAVEINRSLRRMAAGLADVAEAARWVIDEANHVVDLRKKGTDK